MKNLSLLPLGASCLLIVVPKFLRFIMVKTDTVSEYHCVHLHPGMQFITLTHTWRLAFLGEIEPYFNRLFTFRNLLCTVAPPSLRTLSDPLTL
jgi:hypothetical protein